MLPMLFIKEFRQKGVIASFLRFVWEGFGRFRYTVIVNLLVMMFAACFCLQA